MLAIKRNHIDSLTLIIVVTLMLMSIGIVYSASAYRALLVYGESEKMLISHLIKVVVSLGVLFIAVKIDYHKIQHLSKFMLVVGIGLLVITLFIGEEMKNATRWLRVGPISFQPAEFVKFALLFHLCTLIATKGERLKEFKKGFLPMMVWICVVTILVMLQPDFSMGATIFVLGIIMMFVGGVRLAHLSIVFGCLLPILLGYMISAEYRLKRIESFISIIYAFFTGNSRIIGEGNYQLWQGIIAFGNGGIFGVGPGESRQRDLFLPESYGDFIFPIIGEEYGFIGTIIIVSLFLLFMYRGFKISRYAEDVFGKSLAVAITSAITLFAIINAGVTLGVFPTTGLPMPFISYGGSSMVFSAFAVGVLLNISSQTDLHPRIQEIPVVGEANADAEDIGKVY